MKKMLSLVLAAALLLLTGCGTVRVTGEGLQVKELGESQALIVGRLERWAYEE